jgi:lipid-A-disaccharide synthase
MPGSRESEIRRLMPVFGQAITSLPEADIPDLILPTLPHLEDRVRAHARTWPVQPRIITDARDKQAAMRRARAALVASGTATLELALLNVPMVVAYRVSLIEEIVARLMLKIDTIALPNLIVGRRVVPEFLQSGCTGESLARALKPLLAGGAQRAAQLAAFAELQPLMNVAGRQSPSEKAAGIIGKMVRERQARVGQPRILGDGDLLPATNA